MIRQILLGAATVLASAVIVHADAKDDLKAAADKLAAAPSYSFTTDTENANGQGFGTGKSTGKVEKDGYTFLTTPGFQGGETQILIKGDKVAIKLQDTWQTPDEMAAAMGGGGGGGGFNFGAMIANRLKDPIGQAAKNIDKIQNLTLADGVYTGDLSGDDASAAMAGGFGRGGQAPQFTNPKISYKFWITDGVISKAEVHTTGSMDRGGNPVDIDRTATTEITDVGTTKVDAPAEAVAKIEAPAAPAAPPQQ
jgi:hypothetical protein